MDKTLCGYCGVGCGLEYNGKLRGDKEYYVNSGSICSKGLSQLSTIQTDTRLLNPLIRDSIRENFKRVDWNLAIESIANRIKKTSSDKIGFYLSGQLLTEDYYIANKLVKGFLGTNNIDTNSRNCMASAVVAYKKSIGADFVPLKMEDIFDANLLILAGANTAEAHVVFHNQIKKAKKSGLKVVVIDPRETETAKIADLYIPIEAGGDIGFFNLLSKKIIENGLIDKEFIQNRVNGFENLKENLEKLKEEELIEEIGISKELFEEFFKLYRESENIITAWTMGLNQSVQGVDKNLSLINTHLITGKIYKRGCGPLSLTGQPNAMGGREVGGLSTMLAVHLGFEEESIKKVSQFWKSDKIDNRVGLTATEMLSANLDILIIAHTDPIYHLPNRNLTERFIQKIPLVVEINAYDNSETSKFAHIRLPASPWGEKEGVQTNLDRSIRIVKKIRENLGEAKADWEIFQLLAKALGFEKEFNYKSSREIFKEYQEMTKLSDHMNIYRAKYQELEKGFRWGEDIIKEKRFLTKDNRANLFFVKNEFKSEKVSKDYPFILLTGRTRDQWHSGTKTAKSEKLLKYKPLSFVEINSKDAKELNIQNGERVKISSKRGELITIAKVTNRIIEKTIFIPISDRRVNYLTSDLLDPLSKEPDYNHSAVKIIKLKEEN